MKIGWFRTQLPDGTPGFFQRRLDDCLKAAIASCAQVPPHSVSDPQLEALIAAGTDPEQIERVADHKLDVWAQQAGVTIRVHATPPRTGRWIGVVPAADSYNDHCLLMSQRDCLFDPARLFAPSKDEPVSTLDPRDIEYGISLERT
jgi:hypothetical protein